MCGATYTTCDVVYCSYFLWYMRHPQREGTPLYPCPPSPVPPVPPVPSESRTPPVPSRTL